MLDYSNSVAVDVAAVAYIRVFAAEGVHIHKLVVEDAAAAAEIHAFAAVMGDCNWDCVAEVKKRSIHLAYAAAAVVVPRQGLKLEH